MKYLKWILIVFIIITSTIAAVGAGSVTYSIIKDVLISNLISGAVALLCLTFQIRLFERWL